MALRATSRRETTVEDDGMGCRQIRHQRGAQLIGFEWADISTGSIKNNLSSAWVWDEDALTSSD